MQTDRDSERERERDTHTQREREIYTDTDTQREREREGTDTAKPSAMPQELKSPPTGRAQSRPVGGKAQQRRGTG